ncbi:MAG: sigma-70 family RNA polymerase sigma factor [Planctomycetes bacterium]|nr:sigma-70 family RNA polymerase sigma factor [Planctomycetota bacterium]
MTDLPGAPFDLARAGDREAMSALWREHRGWLAATLHAHMPRSAELEDLLQEVAAILVEQIVTIRDGAKLRPWLRTVAINVARTSARRDVARRGTTRPLDEIDEQWATGRDSAVDSAGVELQETLAALDALSADYKEVLLLQCIRGMSQKEIASTLGVPETTVETRLARARRMLRERTAAKRTLQNNER